METAVGIMLIVALVLTVGVLFVGVGTFAFNAEFSRRNSNKLMRARVILQGIAVILFAIVLLLSNH